MARGPGEGGQVSKSRRKGTRGKMWSLGPRAGEGLRGRQGTVNITEVAGSSNLLSWFHHIHKDYQQTDLHNLQLPDHLNWLVQYTLY